MPPSSSQWLMMAVGIDVEMFVERRNESEVLQIGNDDEREKCAQNREQSDEQTEENTFHHQRHQFPFVDQFVSFVVQTLFRHRMLQMFLE